MYFYTTVSPRFTRINSCRNVIVMMSCTITCEAEGFPPPVVNIRRSYPIDDSEDDRIMLSGPITVLTGIGNITSVSMSLIITNTIKKDHGTYRCSARNSVASIEESIFINVQCKALNYTVINAFISMCNCLCKNPSCLYLHTITLISTCNFIINVSVFKCLTVNIVWSLSSYSCKF